MSPDWLAGWPLLPLSGMLLGGLWRQRALIRDGRFWAVVGLALLVSAVVMPLGRHIFDGHEAEYLDIALGRQPLDGGNTYRLPAMQWLYRGLGTVLPFPWALQGFVLLCTALGVGAASSTAARLVSARVGWATGITLALWGNLAAWSSSIYNVALPWALGSVALWGLSLVLDPEEDALGGALVAGGAAGLAVCFRVEALLLAPVGGLLLLTHGGPRWRHWVFPLFVGLGIAGVSTWVLLSAGLAPGSGERPLSLYNNMALFIYFEPFQRPWVLPGVLVGLGIGLWERWRVYLPLALGVVLLHCVMASFNDYATRHVLNAGLALSMCLGALSLRRWAWPLLLVAGVGLLVSLGDLRHRFYAEEELLAQELDPHLPVIGLDELDPGCALICEDTRVVPEGEQRSHFNLLDPQQVRQMNDQQGCVLWLYGVQDHRWSSRAVRDRALRIERLYETEPVAVVMEPEGGYVALVMRVGQRNKWPRATPVRRIP